MAKLVEKEVLIDYLTEAVREYQDKENSTTDTCKLGVSLRSFFWKRGFSCDYTGGCSKGVIVFSGMPFVIKFDSWDKSTDERGTECGRELEIYNEAVKRGLACFFPKTEYLCWAADINFYLQQKIDYQDSRIDNWEYRKAIRHIRQTVTDKMIDKFQKYLERNAPFYVRSISTRWIAAVISLYGKKKALQLEDFIIEMRINDMHDDNVGWYKKKPIILDFSGYYRRQEMIIRFSRGPPVYYIIRAMNFEAFCLFS